MADNIKEKIPEKTLKELRDVESRMGSLTPSELQDFKDYKEYLSTTYEIPKPTALEYALEKTKKDYKTAGKIFDYLPGLMRYAAYNKGSQLVGSPIEQSTDWEKAKSGEGPSSHEYQKRLGVDNRGLGFVSDVALDPMNVLPLLKIAQPVGGALASGGRKIYNTAFKDLDAIAKAKNLPPVTDLLWGAGTHGGGVENATVKGSYDKVAEQIAAKMDNYAKKREALYAIGDEAGAMVHPAEAMDPAIQHLIDLNLAKRPDLTSSNTLGPAMSAIEEHVATPKLTLSEASKVKTGLYDSLPESTWSAMSKTNAGKDIIRRMARGYQQGIETQASRAVPGLGERIAEVNQPWGQLLDVGKQVSKNVKKEATKDHFTKMDVTSGILSAYFGHPGIAVAREAAQLGRGVPGTTWSGLLMNTTGRTGIPDALARDIISANRSPFDNGEYK